MKNLIPKLDYDRENPTEEQILAYGEIAFIAWTVKNAFAGAKALNYASCIHAPVNLGFFEVFYKDRTPAGFYTYGFISDSVIASFTSNTTPLKVTNDHIWYSGDQLWVADFVGEHKPLVSRMYKDVRQVPEEIETIMSLRVYPAEKKPPRVWTHFRIDSKQWGTTFQDANEFFDEKAQAETGRNGMHSGTGSG